MVTKLGSSGNNDPETKGSITKLHVSKNHPDFTAWEKKESPRKKLYEQP